MIYLVTFFVWVYVLVLRRVRMHSKSGWHQSVSGSVCGCVCARVQAHKWVKFTDLLFYSVHVKVFLMPEVRDVWQCLNHHQDGVRLHVYLTHILAYRLLCQQKSTKKSINQKMFVFLVLSNPICIFSNISWRFELIALSQDDSGKNNCNLQ